MYVYVYMRVIAFVREIKTLLYSFDPGVSCLLKPLMATIRASITISVDVHSVSTSILHAKFIYHDTFFSDAAALAASFIFFASRLLMGWASSPPFLRF